MKNNRVAVNMQQFNVSTVVMSTLVELEEIRDELLSVPDSEWFNGKGKKALYDYLLNAVVKEDQFFTSNLHMAVRGAKRWQEFMDDCLLLSVLGSVLFNRTVQLIHPAQYQANLANAHCNATSGQLPDLIEEIPVVFEQTTIAAALSQIN